MKRSTSSSCDVIGTPSCHRYRNWRPNARSSTTLGSTPSPSPHSRCAPMPIIVPRRQPPKPSEVYSQFQSSPIDFLSLLEAPRPPLTYHGRTSGPRRESRGHQSRHRQSEGEAGRDHADDQQPQQQKAPSQQGSEEGEPELTPPPPPPSMPAAPLHLQPRSQHFLSRDVRVLQQRPTIFPRPASGGGGASEGMTLAGFMQQSLEIRTQGQEKAGRRGGGAGEENAKGAGRREASSEQPKQKRLRLRAGGENRKETENDGGHAGAPTKRPSSAGKAIDPTVPELTAKSFQGLERICTLVGESEESIASFNALCERSPLIHVALLFSDLSSTLSPLSRKFCTPKTACPRWNCACEKHIRADRASADVIAALFLIEGQAFFLPLASSARSKKARFTLPLADIQTSRDQRFMCLADILVLETSNKVCFNVQVALMPFLGWLISRDECSPSFLQGFIDPRVAAWVVETAWKESELELDALIARFLPNHQKGGGSSSINRPSAGLSPGCGGAVAMAVGALLDSLAVVGSLWTVLQAKLVEKRCLEAFTKAEMPLACLLSCMEVHGVGFSRESAAPFIAQIDGKRGALAKEIHAQAGVEFNVDSPEQVAAVLYTRLKLPAPVSSAAEAAKQKHASTSEEALVKIKDRHAIVDMILRYRTIAKMKHTYLEALTKHATSEGPMARLRPMATRTAAGSVRIHAQWNQMTVRTGRLSTSKPALQTLPKVFEQESMTINIRKLICASAGTTFLAADYSQIEMRVLAHYSEDARLLNLFATKGDVYKLVMSLLLQKPVTEVTEVERTQAKVVCLGILYGMGPASAASRLNISISEAQALIHRFLNTFPNINLFTEKARAFARRNGFVCTIMGRLRYIPNITSQDTGLRAQAERQAVNTIIQGTASDIMKIAMISAQQKIDEHWGALKAAEDEERGVEGHEPRPTPTTGPTKPILVLQIHDELVYECPAQSTAVTALRDILRTAMETSVTELLPLRVPLVVNMSVGSTLGSLRPVPLADLPQPQHS